MARRLLLCRIIDIPMVPPFVRLPHSLALKNDELNTRNLGIRGSRKPEVSRPAPTDGRGIPVQRWGIPKTILIVKSKQSMIKYGYI